MATAAPRTGPRIACLLIFVVASQYKIGRAAHPRDEQKFTAAETMHRLRASSMRGDGVDQNHEARVTVAVERGTLDRNHLSPCVSLDWWPASKCDYDVCAWDRGESFLTTDLSSPKLRKAVAALAPVLLRLGGTLTDFARIGMEEDASKDGTFCTPLSDPVTTNRAGYDFNRGCLTLSRWDELHAFAQDTGASLVMGINALNGRSRREACRADIDCHYDYAMKDVSEAKSRYHPYSPCCCGWVGEWDSSDARRLLEHVRSKGQHVHGLEFGNELVGDGGIVAHLDAAIYARDFCQLYALVHEIFPKSPPKLIAFNAAVDTKWLSAFRTEIGNYPGCSPDVIAWHGYLLGKGLCRGDCDEEPEAGARAIDPTWLDKQKATAEDMARAVNEWRDTVNKNIELWVGEAGGAYNSGAPFVTDAFHSSFWFLDSLGVVGERGHSAFCRQSLHGGNYGLLARGSSFAPAPDFFALLLWQKLMGKESLGTSFVDSDDGSSATDDDKSRLRMYARRAADGSSRTTVLLINLSREKSFVVDLQEGGGDAPVVIQAYYSVTGDSLSAKTVYLNGKPLLVDPDTGMLPEMQPMALKSNSVTLTPLSYSFVVLSKEQLSESQRKDIVVDAPADVPARRTELRMVHAGIRQALSRWDEEATKHGIKYHLEFGALLGWARGEEIIPHDHDADLLIDASSIPILERLALDSSEETSFFLDAGNHPPLPPRAPGRVPPVWVLFRAKTHGKDFSDIDRVDCQGRNRGTKNVDGCSFTGPVGRIIHFGGEFERQAYVDLFLAGCPYRTDAQVKTWHCRKATNDCSYCPSTEAVPNTLQLPEHGGGLRRCYLSGVRTWCPKSRKWSEDHLRRIYGEGWRNEDEKYQYSNSASVERKPAKE